MLLQTVIILLGCAVQVCPTRNSYIEAAKLGSLAKSSALHAQNLAFNQELAASHAAFSIKNDLAQTALIAAAAARAAVISKKLHILALQEQLKQAEQMLEEEVEQYEHLKEVEATFSKAAEESQSQVDTIERILKFVKNDTCKNEDLKSDGWISFGTGFH